MDINGSVDGAGKVERRWEAAGNKLQRSCRMHHCRQKRVGMGGLDE